MAITLNANPAVLTAGHFVAVPPPLVDPADGTPVDAYTTFNFNIPALPPTNAGGAFRLADPNVITVTPNCRRLNTVVMTPALLSHEQFHYDVGVVTGRALARHLMRLRAPNVAALGAMLRDAVRLHFTTRAGLLQSRYDRDSRHGTNAHYQNIWKNRMSACLADPNATQLGGFFL